MLLTITNLRVPATDLGYLLHKHPERMHSIDLPFGKAHVFYPEADAVRCTAALLLEIDPVGLVRKGRGESDGATVAHYVNDRPYAASSFLSVAMGRAFNTAMSGRSKDRPELVQEKLPLEVEISALPCRGGEALVRRLFEPLGYHVAVDAYRLDETMPQWGESPYLTVRLRGKVTLQSLLNHLYVLIPVLDNDKHYWIGDDEVDKLLRKGEGWLGTHPERELISTRYLKYRRELMREALARLLAEEIPALEEDQGRKNAEEETIEQSISLNEQRYDAVCQALLETGATSVIDLGCGEGKLLKRLFRDKSFDRVAGMDVSIRALELAADRLRLEGLSERQKSRVELFQGSLMYRDARLSGFDAACAVEVVEHLDPPRLAAFERTVFECARPATVVVTTPNAEYNVRFPTLAAGVFRHRDHRFEWTRHEFQRWAGAIAEKYKYRFEWRGIGLDDPEVGSPTQMGIFTRVLES